MPGLAENKYGIEDPEIISAIACHTTGKADMSVLDKIVYIADYIEPRRYKADNLPQMRRLAYEDLDQTMYEILAGTINYLKGKGGCIDPMTIQTFNWFEKLIQEKCSAAHGGFEKSAVFGAAVEAYQEEDQRFVKSSYLSAMEILITGNIWMP